MSMDVVLGFFFLALAYIVASIFYPLLTGGAGYTPTPRRMVAEALRMAALKKDEVFFDLGCGTGEALIEASKVCDSVEGVEIEPLRWLIARLRARKARVILGNLFNQDISDADVVFIYQYRGNINHRIATKIKAETRSGTRVISYGHRIDNLNFVKGQGEIFIYRT